MMFVKSNIYWMFLMLRFHSHMCGVLFLLSIYNVIITNVVSSLKTLSLKDPPFEKVITMPTTLLIAWILRNKIFIPVLPTHFSVRLSATNFHFHSLLSQKHDDEIVPLSPDRLCIPVLNVLKCCQSAHIFSARQANRINPGLTHQAQVQGNGLG